MTSIGLVGLGLLGSALAERCLSTGLRVHGFDLNPERRKFLAALGGIDHGCADDVVRTCDIVVLSLPDSQVVARVVESLHGLLNHHLIIDTTTGAPSDAARLGKQLQNQEVEYLDATVVGSSVQARNGEVLVLAGGTDAGFQKALPILKCYSAQQFHTGPWGTGATAKLIVNLVLGLNRAVLAEALNLARQCEMDAAGMLQILRSGAAYSRVMDAKGDKMLTSDFSPQARLDQHWKDVGLILELGRTSGAQVPLSELHAKLLEKASQLGYGALDNSAIIKAFES